jgi:hypothetical protein
VSLFEATRASHVSSADHEPYADGLKSKLQGVRHFILDEGDQLLDAGFKPEVEKICRALPSRAIQPRQTLLFSATVPSRLTSVVSLALLPGYAHLSSITPGEENTHAHVPQQATVVEWPDIYGAALGVISEEMQRDPDGYKVIVFAPTARAAAVLYEAINAGFDVGPAFQIHSYVGTLLSESCLPVAECSCGSSPQADVAAGPGESLGGLQGVQERRPLLVRRRRSGSRLPFDQSRPPGWRPEQPRGELRPRPDAHLSSAKRSSVLPLSD